MSKIFLGWDDYKPYEFELPKVPDDKEILGYDIKNKSDQIWKRVIIPNFNKMREREISMFIEEDERRCDDGVWFMNNGEPTYITGMHYEHLVHNRFPKFIGDKYPGYYDSQREDFYFRHILMNDPMALGGIWIKGRRYGLTAEEITNQLYISTHDFDQECKMMSLNEEKAYKTLFNPLMYVLRNRVDYKRPNYYAPTGTEPQKKLEFLTKKMGDKKIQLGSIITPVPTTAHVLDGETVHYCSADEVFKWPKVCDPYLFHGVTKETLLVGLNKRGIVNYTSTVGDDDKINEAAIAAGAKLWSESDANQRDEYGRTASGLYKWFIPAWKALEGFIDKHGFPEKDKAINFILNNRSKHIEGSKEWMAIVRKYPISEDEVWNTIQSVKMFDGPRLNAQIQSIKNSSVEEDFGIIRGNLERSKEVDKVFFKPSNSGYWEFNGLPHPKSANRFFKDSNGYNLPEDREYAIGFDPVRYTKTTSTHLSKNAIVALQKQKFDWDNGTDIVIPDFKIKCIYSERLETKEESYEHAILTALFLSGKLCAESQVSNFIEDYAQPKGYGKILTLSPYTFLPGVWTTVKSTEDGVGYIQDLFLRRPKPNSPFVEEQLDHLVKCGFEKLLAQLRDFDPKNTTKSDIVMALIMAFFEYIQMSTVRRPALNKAMNDAMSALFSKHG